MGDHPIHLVIEDDLARSRVTVGFRLVLVIPHLVLLYVWSWFVWTMAVVNWFVFLVNGQLPRGLHDFQAEFLRYQTEVAAYVLLVANPYPPFGGGPYPVDLAIAPLVPQSRWTVLFRLFLAVPALLLAAAFVSVIEVLTILAWFVCLATGRIPEGMRNLNAFALQYLTQTTGYLFLLTASYPSLSVESDPVAAVTA